MANHFRLFAAARTVSLGQVLRMVDAEAETTFAPAIWWRLLHKSAKAQDRLLRAGGGQADPDACPELLDTGGDLDQAQADGVDLGGAPGRALGQGRLERPAQPIRRGVEQQAELVG